MKSIPQLIEEQVHRWQLSQIEKPEKKDSLPIITISREPGSGGRIVAQKLAQRLELHLFHQEVVHAIAKRADYSKQLLETLDEKGLSVLEDWVASMLHERHMWPHEYLQHLMKVVGTIARHGRAVIVGRGANFILPPDNRLRLRIVAPQKLRIMQVARDFDVSEEMAKRRVIRTESDRRAFIRKYFNAEIGDPMNYDLILNTEMLSVEDAVNAVATVLKVK